MNKLIFRGENITVFKVGRSEIIVYGNGCDWMVQRSDVTNYKWSKWFSKRADAEKFASSASSDWGSRAEYFCDKLADKY